MSITFHMKSVVSFSVFLTRPPSLRNDDHNSPNHDSQDDESLSEKIKHYIQREEDISQHDLWNQDGFWEDALMIGFKAQLDMMDPVLWDELDPEMLKEKVLGRIHKEFFLFERLDELL